MYRSRALRWSEDLLASLDRTGNEGLFRVTSDLRRVHANRALAHLLGHDTPAGLGRSSWLEAIHEPDRLAAGLTRQLLAYSRQQVLAPQVLDLAVVVDELGEMLR